MKVATFTVRLTDPYGIACCVEDSAFVQQLVDQLYRALPTHDGSVTVTFEGIADDAASPEQQE